MTTNVEALAAFTADTRFEDLPPAVVQEAKRLLVDSIGCGLGGLSHPKGAIGVKYAAVLGPGAPGEQATIIGTGERVSAVGAAFANGELINALDFDAVLPPGHVSPYVIPPALAAAEGAKASGRSLLAAVAISHEMTNRIGKSMSALRDTKDGKASPPAVFGFSQSIFGAAAGVGKVKGLSKETIAAALGIAGSMSPVQSQWSWSVHVPTATVKYGLAGAVTQAAMAASSLAELGHTGDIQMLDDGEFGYSRMIGSTRWTPERMMANLGKEWFFIPEQVYKLYPHCRILSAPLDVLRELVEKNDIKPSEIEGIKAWVEGFVMEPLWLNRKIDHVTQVQFSMAHGLSVGAHRVPPGKAWQSPEVVNDPSIMALMDKIEFEVHPEYAKLLNEHPASRPTRIEVRARGTTFVGEKRFPRGGATPDPATFVTDDELSRKFVVNAEGVLSARTTDAILQQLWSLEKVDDVGRVMALFQK
ncbi:MmgE/PrpD family protein [Ramlibacter sp.]|uniref:MmgE/PrpD family protein n=1 Tax=Ramlibacter sp. TaxID=1917967 RepID=UPI003D13AE2B